MKNVQRANVLMTTAILLTAVTSCNNSSTDPQRSAGPTAPITAVTTLPSDAKEASEAASDVAERYFTAVDLLRQQPERPLGELAAVSISTQLTAQKKLIQRLRDQGVHQIGDTKVASVEVQSVDLDHSSPSAGRVPTAMIDVCWDVSQVDVIDKNGKSVVSPDRANTGWTRFTVANYEWSSDPTGGWRVAGGQDLKQAPCAAS